MARPPSPKNAKVPLRLLRGLLSEHGEKSPITQGDLSKLIGIAANTIKAIENSQRPLTDAAYYQILLGTGAVWDEALGQWVCAASSVPFTREFHIQFRERIRHRPKDTESDVEILKEKIEMLFGAVPDDRWFPLLFRVDRFLDECRQEFGVEGLDVPFTLLRPGLVVIQDDAGRVKEVNRKRLAVFNKGVGRRSL